MPQHSEPNRSTLHDTDTGYGWISILLHWVTAVTIIALWFIGKGIMSSSAEAIDARRALHVSIASAAWLVILFRIVWRIRSGHPWIRGQSDTIHRISTVNHYLMIAVSLLMLLSGPFLVWADGRAIDVFGVLTIPGPIGQSAAIRELAWAVHENLANLLGILVLLHFSGAMKHLMFHTDDTIVRMLWPPRTGDSDQ
jgi:cytochrome b561